MKSGFNVTYEIVNAEEAEAGDTDRRGFICEDVSLREAVEAFGGKDSACEPNIWPINDSVRWFTNFEYGNGTRAYYEQGDNESRSLHIPEQVTGSSRLRIARLLGLRTGH